MRIASPRGYWTACEPRRAGARLGAAERRRPAAESRGRGVGARRDAALAGRRRHRERDPRRVRLLPREPREDLSRGARAVGEGRAGRRDHARGRARRAGGARGSGWPGARGRARSARSRRVERRALRAHRQGDGHAPRAHPRGSGDRAARAGARRRGHRPRRPRRADRLRARPAEGDERLQSHPGAPQGEFRAHHAPLRSRRGDHGRPDGVQGARPPHLRLPAGQPRHPRRAPVDGEVGPRPVHGGEPRGAPPDARRPVHARDVEGRGHATDDVQRGEGRVPTAPDGTPRARRLAAADRCVRPPDEGADLRRRRGLRRRSWSSARRRAA